jgi:protein TonB
MERPNHLHTSGQSNSSKVTGLVIVIAIHVLAIMGLITALASGQIMKQLQEIKATVDREKPAPKAPPPPPPDLVKPPPPIAIVPTFQVQQEAPPPVTTVPKPPPAPPKAAPAPSPTALEPIRRTFTLPPYPPISQRLGEQGTTTLKITIGTDGTITEATVEKSSGSARLDQAAQEYVKAHYRYKPPTVNGQPTTAVTLLNVVWNLKDAQ